MPEMTSSYYNSNPIVTTSYTHTITSESNEKPIIADLDVIYVLAGLGGGILILAILVVTMCTIYFFVWLPKRKRQLLTLTAAPPHNVYTMEEDEQPHGRYHASSLQELNLMVRYLKTYILNEDQLFYPQI